MAGMTFGDCLSFLLSILDISMNRLSRAINVDNSLVNRWIHGKRIPPYNTAYIENIAEYLSRNFHNSTQINHLNELFCNICGNNASASLIKDKIRMILSECQGYSIECRKKERIKNNNTDVKDIINQNSLYCRNTSKKILSLSADDKIFFGTGNTLSLCIDLLKSAVNLRSLRSITIYITYSNYLETKSGETVQLINEIKTQLLKAAGKGINVCFLVKLDSNINRTLDFIRFIYPVLLTGRLMVYYNIKYSIADSDREIFVVPGIGAISCIPAGESSHEKCGFFFKNKNAVNIFNNYFKMLLKSNSRELIKYYTRDTDMEYYHDLLEAQENIGSSFLYRTGQHPLMMSVALFRSILERKGFSKKVISCSAEIFEMHLNTFKKNICRYEYYDVCSLKAVTNLINSREFPLLINGTIETVVLDTDELLKIIENVIHTVKSFGNYKLCFTQEKDFFGYGECCVFIKEKCALLYEMHGGSGTAPETKLSINEPMVVIAAEKYFMEKYEQIAPINKDKDEIIRFLEKQMHLLNNEKCR